MQVPGILKPVGHATPWVSSFIIARKTQFDKHCKSQLQICLNPSSLKQAIAREPLYYITADGIFHKPKKLQ